MDSKRVVAWISNSLTPYRIQLFDRILREIPAVSLLTGFTHGSSSAPWKQDYPTRIQPERFHQGEPLPVRYTPGLLLRDWQKGGEMVRWLERARPRAVVLAGYNDPGLLRVMRWCVRNNTPYLISADSNIHADSIRGWKSQAKRALLRQIVHHAKGLLVCGQAGVSYFRRYGASNAQLFIVPCESEFGLFQNPHAEDVERARVNFDLRPLRRRVVYCGRLVEYKRVDLLIDAFSSIALLRPEWDVVIIGDGPLRESLQNRIPMELRHRFIWTGFVEDTGSIAAMFRHCQMLVLPSDYEPWGIVISEAAAAGLAVIASDVVGAAIELVKNEVNGFRFEAGKLSALTAALSVATETRCVEKFSMGSRAVYSDWRRTFDPIDGLKQALCHVGVFTTGGQT